MQLWLCPILAFLMGSVPFGLLIARSQGIDIRQHGSGNIGATNVLRVLGKKFGIPCLLLDALKGFIPVVIALSLVRIAGKDAGLAIPFLKPWSLELASDQRFTGQLVHVLTGLMAILGHNYSPWVGFKGGKGIATSAGVLIALMPFAVLILLAVWGILFATTRYVSVASMGASACLPIITVWGSWFHGRIQDGTWNKPLFALSVAIAVMAIWKHRSNIQRLLNGTENRFVPKSKRS